MPGVVARLSLYRFDLRMRMILSTGIVAAFFLLVGTVYVDLFKNMAERQVEELNRLLGAEVETHMQRTAETLQRTALLLGYSSDVQGALYAPSPLARMQNLKIVRGTVRNFAELSPAILNILIYRNDHNKITASESSLALQTRTLRELALHAGQTECFTPILCTNGGVESFMYILPFRNALYLGGDQEEDGVCAILYDLREFIYADLFKRGSVNHLVVSDGQEVHPLTPMEPELAQRLIQAGTGMRELDVQGARCIAFGYELPLTGWRLTYALPRADIVSVSMGAYRRYMIWIGFGAMAVIAFELYNLCYIAQSIRKVTRAVGSTRGTEGTQIDKPGLPEMRMLAVELNSLLARIDRERAESARAQQRFYDAMLAKNEAEMAFYRSQISPHFLFNTLECIRSMAQHYGAQPVDRLIFATSRVLQYSLYTDVIVPLRDELENARCYAELMNVRAMNAYDYREAAESRALVRPMVSMILQPLLENAFRHGARGLHGRRFTLLVRASVLEDGTLELRVVDNGRGMSAQALAALNRSIAEGGVGREAGGIGILNVDRRLRLADPGCRMYILSSQGHYTAVVLRIPQSLVLEEDIRRQRTEPIGD